MGELTGRGNQPQPINIWLEQLHLSKISDAAEPESVRVARAQKDEAIIVLLGQLSLVYWRPDFSPAQAKQLYLQYLDDLRDFAFSDIVEAIEKYRRDPESKFFPAPGQLRGLITTPYNWDPSPRNHMKERLEASKAELAQVCDRALLTG